MRERSGLGRRHLRDQLEDEFGSTPQSTRVVNILEGWEMRGAMRPITDFYDVDETLGEGASGVVQKWKLKAPADLEEPYVAVKLIRWKSIWNGRVRRKDQEQSLRNELKMLLVLDHPFIIRFREWFEQPCCGIFFVMELCTGRSLQHVLEDLCELPKAEDRQAHMPRLQRYFREVSYAVSYIHSLDPPVIHRDLKPENVLLQNANDPGSVTKLADFGLSTLRDHQDNKAFHQGTPVFMAPEQYLSSCGEVTQEMDIWALGVIFAWIITALERGALMHPMLPTGEGEAFDVPWIRLYWAYRDRKPWNRELFGSQPDSAYHLCEMMLQHDPSERARASDILKAEWVRAGDPAAAAASMLISQGHVITNVITYRQLGALDKKILSLVAEYARDSEVVSLQRTFQALDTTKSGKLCCLDLSEGFRSHGVEIPKRLVKSIFNAMDTDGSDTIEYQEWLAATIGRRVLLSNRAVSNAFRCLNVSATGRITHAELVRAVGFAAANAVMCQNDVAKTYNCISFKKFRRMVEEVANRRQAIVQHLGPGGADDAQPLPPYIDAAGKTCPKLGPRHQHASLHRSASDTAEGA